MACSPLVVFPPFAERFAMNKVFKFHARRGQQRQVADLLRQYGETAMEITDAGGVRVTVILPEGVSKRSVDKMLRDAAVPGAASCRNVPIVDVGYSAEKMDEQLARLASKGYLNRKVKLSWGGTRVSIGWLRAEPYSDGPGYGFYIDGPVRSAYQYDQLPDAQPGQQLPWC